MPQRLLLTKNAQFFTQKPNINLDSALSELVTAATANRVPNANSLISLTREARVIPETNISYRLTVDVYPSIRDVYFWDNEDISDLIYAYFIIIEMHNFIGLFRKSCSDISRCLDRYFENVTPESLTATFDDSVVDFQKISLRNMTISDRALRARSYEAADLKGLLSSHAAGRSIPYFFKIRQGSKIRTISANSARIVEAANRVGIEEIALWVKQQIDLLANPSRDKDFLKSFAKQVALRDVIARTEPCALLIESNALSDRLEEENLEIYRKARNTNILLKLSSRSRDLLIQSLEKVYEIDTNKRITHHENTSKIRVNDKSITLSSKLLNRFWLVTADGSEISLQNFIIRHNLFSVCFADPRFMYFMGRCFEDSAGIAEVDSLLNLLQPIPELINVTSEKGQINPRSRDFDLNSMFKAIELHHANDDYVFCDDFGNEWADHITFNRQEPSICFIHSKFGDLSTSASNLHDVVGQGIKNLGSMYFTNHTFQRKLAGKLNTNYLSSLIPRVRKSIPGAIDLYTEALLKEYRLNRKCILACSFISKQQITNEFRTMAQGSRVRGNVIQLFWILSSFAHAAKENNIEPIIYCRS